ncbi:arsenate reductase family protein [Feifania hominis]|uniref:Arsenate reductase family protein n=1 Tax=Feifania hominis TaxID=2763660 RepID=A0A926DF53_9FIRM|nr:arsenate reductase family protein [Feifania hominis]MBC8536144.1 arsenate reductase family protein [Feifania hominis]
MLFLEYPPCSTCRRAREWLVQHGVAFESRHIKENNPTAQELDVWQQKSGLPLERFFNTSGMIYRERALKDKLPRMDRAEKLAQLATDGMLVKRPLLIGDDFVLVGFKPAEWEQKLLK